MSLAGGAAAPLQPRRREARLWDPGSPCRSRPAAQRPLAAAGPALRRPRRAPHRQRPPGPFRRRVSPPRPGARETRACPAPTPRRGTERRSLGRRPRARAGRSPPAAGRAEREARARLPAGRESAGLPGAGTHVSRERGRFRIRSPVREAGVPRLSRSCAWRAQRGAAARGGRDGEGPGAGPRARPAPPRGRASAGQAAPTEEEKEEKILEKQGARSRREPGRRPLGRAATPEGPGGLFPQLEGAAGGERGGCPTRRRETGRLGGRSELRERLHSQGTRLLRGCELAGGRAAGADSDDSGPGRALTCARAGLGPSVSLRPANTEGDPP